MTDKILDFEKPLLELHNKIDELQSFMQEKNIDLSSEINRLQKRAKNVREEIYSDLKPGQILKIARHPERPLTLEYIDYITDDFMELHGDRRFGDDQALIGGIGLIDGRPVTILGHQKGRNTKENIDRNFGMAHPEGYRKALRLMKQAEKFDRPVINLINTPGAYPGIGAEERGQAEAIATNLQEMSALQVPIIVIIIGEGGSGGALGIGLGDKVMMMEFSYYSVSSPEACAAILWKDSDKAEEAAEALKLTARDLKELEIIDEIIREPAGGAHKNPEKAAKILKYEIVTAINDLRSQAINELLEKRYQKFRNMGQHIEKKVEDSQRRVKDEKTDINIEDVQSK
ncbi:MAG: acetyl-CoA carboxylase carboxyltransferase subunit alpha [Halanaerobiaceae bacterium]